ncbi:ubiquitin fusion degradation protein UFD1-domain-containing protein [Polychytrium aggregatum]|uniref:ubiquitin fusion degradation protein UFD1-domain-containing protein n=1 Tax=Polychytrium aggregatum TaxID=110093 RepID=UPI0022FDEC98|nr:ubiquitin fusion degradation protein UFD1-domain-containing protein [Polychytrium aggregatum]KAI9203118.1 ubiquitin fusion degradation protein UFD1-domain-containing protein [Polychytrium aggregatum]
MGFARMRELPPFSDRFRCYSIAMKPDNDKPELNFGGKILLPPSALHKLAQLSVEYPMLFSIGTLDETKVSHSGVLEFTAEEGRVYVPQWMMQTLLIEEGTIVRVTNVRLPLGTFVKLQPQSVDFLDITDPKAVLENTLRNFSTLTENDIITIQYNDKSYEILVMETRPKGRAISIVETDLEVDFAAPVGYKEPEPTPKSYSVSSLPSSSIEEHIVERENQFVAFKGSGNNLKGTVSITNTAEMLAAAGASNVTEIPAALHLPSGKLFFGYPIVPLPGSEAADANAPSAFAGQGSSLRSAKGKGSLDSDPGPSRK